MICQGSRLGRIHGVSRVDHCVLKSLREGNGQGSEAQDGQASGARVEASRGVEHYTPMPAHRSVRLNTTTPNRIEPDMTPKPTQPPASRESGALAGGVGVAPHEQPQLFNTPQTTRTSDDYWTPSWVFELMNISFDLDVASPPGGSPWVPSKHYYTQEDDGLTSPWHGRVWMNPPYSNTSPWARKFIQHKNGICLVPTAKARWFNELWDDADCLVLNDSRFKFHQGGIFIQTIFAAYGHESVKAIKRLGKGR